MVRNVYPPTCRRSGVSSTRCKMGRDWGGEDKKASQAFLASNQAAKEYGFLEIQRFKSAIIRSPHLEHSMSINE